ncbi:glycoside hydrolase family 53 protein [Flavivirga spongiicola]|uniref:Arabinogalactan endo-beta-1,4-galactanase n=1 Tax=Flavivirga spongiicola TaxID=421621 RepID=A0ABU7XYF2_9FLAO|nr:glycosyl hydrolase 53 family protein [Flavivirga sp. MEBiC05379]MDO5980802.1 glycosyl hydrolase 53 family protein [Flavivirga sp. MEBiC05379]
MKHIITYLAFSILITVCIGCETYEVINTENPDINFENNFEQKFYNGSDLSYVNEMLDCGASYNDLSGNNANPYEIFKNAGNNLVRVRLWNDPSEWTAYSNIEDVEKTISSSKEQGMDVLLDFHYSDTWADPGNQIIPSAWLDVVDDTEALGERLYNYTYETLNNLAAKELLPEIVQIGNEINSNILNKEAGAVDIDWERNAFLLNKGIQAVRDISKKYEARVQIMLHIAQPENALWWFEQANENGIVNYDWIGVSYYPKWSDYQVSDVSDAIVTLGSSYNKKVMIVETAYPFTTENADVANNILGKSVYPATQQGQLEFLLDLKREIKEGNGFGFVYWEPAWVSTGCGTLWADSGSHWDNATLFDNNGNPTLGLNALNDSYMPDITCSSIWALGNGVPDALWNWDNAIEITCDGTSNSIEVNLAEGHFRFFQTEGDWTSGIGYQYFVNRGYTIDAKLKGVGDGDDNFVFEGTEGLYTLEIDHNAKTIVLEPVISEPFYALGDTLPGGWSFDDATLVESPIFGIRKATVNLSPGTFRFFTIKDDWASGLNYAYFADQGYTIDANLENAGDGDQNFRFTGTIGEYVLEINDHDKTITLLGTGPFPSLWTVGDAVPGGWGFNDDTIEFTQTFGGIWTANLDLNSGVFRFFQTFGTWDTNNNYAFYANEGFEIDANFENDGSGDENFRFIGTPGAYTLTINANNKKITLEEYDKLPSLWAVGDAVPGGWGFNDDTVEFTQSSENIWSAEIALSNGGIFRFFQTFDTWDTNNNYAFYAGEGYTIDTNFSEQDAADKNFLFNGTTGLYTLTINGNDKTITLE